jgi:predicted nucleic acid-binding protein
MDANPLAPRDAFHLAVVLQHEIPSLVTADRDFRDLRLPEDRGLTIVTF